VTAFGGGQFLGGLIGRYSHWQMGFVVLAVVGAISAIATTTLTMDAGQGRNERAGMVGIYLRILAVPEFLLPTIAGGLGFATIVLLQEVAPFVFQQHFGLSVDAYGNIGLLFGLSYFAGAVTVHRLAASAGPAWLMRLGALIMTGAGTLLIILWSLPGIPLGAALVAFIVLYCATVFGQAALFPSSIAVAVSNVKERGAYAVALCGFLAQSIAGLAATVAATLHNNLTWTGVATALSALAYLLVRHHVARRSGSHNRRRRRERHNHRWCNQRLTDGTCTGFCPDAGLPTAAPA
jgi:DHA1 family bicyclomycin/chloramphenicol resistance-like MFS transporter